jgi:3-oxoacyl-[acyl-carrier-protein] synthase II
MRRVVVTGLGLVTPVGADVETAWANIIAVQIGRGTITRFDATDQACTIACEVKPADHPNMASIPASVSITRSSARSIRSSSTASMRPARRWKMPACSNMSEEDSCAGCSIGSGIGGLPGIASESLVLRTRGRAASPAFRPRPPDQPDLGPGFDQIWPDGPEPCRRHRLLDRRALDRRRSADDRDADDADIMLAGGAEGAICPLGIAGFAQARALSTGFNDDARKGQPPL